MAKITTVLFVSLAMLLPLESFAADEDSSTPMFGKVYAGFGITRDLMHLNAEMPTKWANVYIKGGQFINGSGIAGQVGFRKAYKYTSTDKTGYYFGGFVGHTFPDHLDGDRYNRLGAGGEMSYVWQNASRLNSVSVTLSLTKGETEANGNTLQQDVKIGFGATIQVPLFD